MIADVTFFIPTPDFEARNAPRRRAAVVNKTNLTEPWGRLPRREGNLCRKSLSGTLQDAARRSAALSLNRSRKRALRI